MEIHDLSKKKNGKDGNKGKLKGKVGSIKDKGSNGKENILKETQS